MIKSKPRLGRAYDIYKKARDREDKHRLVIVMPADEVQAVDLWAVSSGMKNRTEAIRNLLEFALETKKAPGLDANQTPDASDSE